MTFIALTIALILQGGSESLAKTVETTATLSSGALRSVSIGADAGDFVSGPLELTGSNAQVSVYDPSGLKLRSFTATAPFRNRVGFVAPKSGAYRIEFSGATAAGSFHLRLDAVGAAAKMSGFQTPPTRRLYRSERITTLERNVKTSSTALAEFWEGVAGPLVEPSPSSNEDVLVTFLWRQTYPVFNVLVLWPPAEAGPSDYYMSHLEGTDVWYKTIRLRKGTRISYHLAANTRGNDHFLVRQLDPLAAYHYPEDLDPTDMSAASVLELDGAPRLPAADGAKGTLHADTVNSPAGSFNISVYTPAGFRVGSTQYPVLVLLQHGGYTYIKDMRAVTTLDSLIAIQQMKPTVVAFVTLPGGDSAWTVMPDFLSVTLVPLLRTKYFGTQDPADTAIGGASVGAAIAALTALRRPDIFGRVLAQSGAFRGRMPTQRAEPNALAAIFAESPRVQLKWYLDVGLYDNVVEGPIDEMALDESNTMGNRHFRDVLIAKGYDVVYREVGGGHSPLHWRATLPDALVSLFRP